MIKKIISKITLLLIILNIISCSDKELEPEYRKLALKMYKNKIQKPLSEFTTADSLICYDHFKVDFERRIKSNFPIKGISPYFISTDLNAAYNVAEYVIKNSEIEFEDSLNGFWFLTAFSHLSSISSAFNSDLLKDLEFNDCVEVYLKYLPEKAQESIDSNDSNMNYLVFFITLYCHEPTSYNVDDDYKPVSYKVFLYLRRNIVIRKLRASLSEKQKLYMEEDYNLFLQSLSEKQAALFQEFNKITSYLD
jgi:hypothetical protein